MVSGYKNTAGDGSQTPEGHARRQGVTGSGHKRYTPGTPVSHSPPAKTVLRLQAGDEPLCEVEWSAAPMRTPSRPRVGVVHVRTRRRTSGSDSLPRRRYANCAGDPYRRPESPPESLRPALKHLFRFPIPPRWRHPHETAAVGPVRAGSIAE